MRLPAFASILLLVAACGGTSSETPWPREPENVDLGPAGERATEDAPFEQGSKPGEAAPATIADPQDPALAPRK
jgi:hypothetical protein